MNDFDYFLETTFSPSLIYIKVRLAIILVEIYLVTGTGDKKLGK
tara:strand:- start:319 stop:450 length:132 start_codon:yes stop_codon:yes gene_type:complete